MRNVDPREISKIIRRYLSRNASDEDLRVLRQWLEADARNPAFISSLEDGRRVLDEIELMRSFDVARAWERTREKHTQRVRRQHERARLIRRVSLGVGSIAASLAIWAWLNPSAFSAFVPFLDTKKELVNIVDHDINPGGDKAYLTLSDGRVVQLKESWSSVSEIDGTEILGEDGRLIYQTDQSPGEMVLFNTLHVPNSGRYRLELADGTQVWLNAGSEIVYPVRFSIHERRVRIQGEAYFSVNHDRERPFVIDVGSAEIEVLGTDFNVNAYDDEVITTLVEGKVRIRNQDGVHELLPGQESRFDRQHYSIREADVKKVTSWLRNEFYFKKDNLASIMEQLSRWYDIEVEYQGEIPQHILYTGQISREVKLGEVLEMLAYLGDAKYQIKDNKVHVKF